MPRFELQTKLPPSCCGGVRGPHTVEGNTDAVGIFVVSGDVDGGSEDVEEVDVAGKDVEEVDVTGGLVVT
jgi:hypothetical protein